MALLLGGCGGDAPVELCTAGPSPPDSAPPHRFTVLDRSGALGNMRVSEVWDLVGEALHGGPPPDSATTRAIVCALRTHPAHWSALVVHFMGTPAMSHAATRREVTAIAARLLSSDAVTARSLAPQADAYVWHSAGVSFAEVHPDASLLPGVIASLDDPPPADAYQASTEFLRRQRVLVRLTGEASAPRYDLPSAESRSRATAFWNAWWTEHGRGFSVASQNAAARAVQRWRERRN